MYVRWEPVYSNSKDRKIVTLQFKYICQLVHNTGQSKEKTNMYPVILEVDRFLALSLFVLRFYRPVNPMGSCRARSVFLTTRLLGKLSPLSS